MSCPAIQSARRGSSSREKPTAVDSSGDIRTGKHGSSEISLGCPFLRRFVLLSQSARVISGCGLSPFRYQRHSMHASPYRNAQISSTFKSLAFRHHHQACNLKSPANTIITSSVKRRRLNFCTTMSDCPTTKSSHWFLFMSTLFSLHTVVFFQSAYLSECHQRRAPPMNLLFMFLSGVNPLSVTTLTTYFCSVIGESGKQRDGDNYSTHSVGVHTAVFTWRLQTAWTRLQNAAPKPMQ